MLRALEWDVNSGEDTMACLDCLAARRKIVLISLRKKYVWMITYQTSFPSCEFCSRQSSIIQSLSPVDLVRRSLRAHLWREKKERGSRGSRQLVQSQ
uniref:AlNc14C24G2391 protein n=1 Tax=Albugo laibachii Nc14 TaxID=890382 RepID=F0W691_9STRA|nr:AlNc14C24G2391 [Albugo laibachii Nc14]|eukprot:CCA16634.1 AlNc14C24G2391 [Albugo laibachii Nc14]